MSLPAALRRIVLRARRVVHDHVAMELHGDVDAGRGVFSEHVWGLFDTDAPTEASYLGEDQERLSIGEVSAEDRTEIERRSAPAWIASNAILRGVLP